jgi:hypothetical protein
MFFSDDGGVDALCEDIGKKDFGVLDNDIYNQQKLIMNNWTNIPKLEQNLGINRINANATI